MRNYVLLYVNGRRYQVTGNDVFLSLSDYVRCKLRMTGTKVVCSEGDCGSCTVLCGRRYDDRLQYQAVLSCIQFVYQLDGCHVVTIEGLHLNESQTALQKSMVRCHGSQCGFCTPGFVVAMTGLLEQQTDLDISQWREGLTGNLCRCTGYTPILEAGRTMDVAAHRHMEQLYPSHNVVDDARRHATDCIAIQTEGAHRRQLFSPTTVCECVQLYAEHPDAKLVAGGTDVGVQVNKGLIAPDVVIELNRIDELTSIQVDDDFLVMGSRASWTKVMQRCQDLLPELARILSVFGSPQIRHVGTVGGNIINASPIADSLPFLLIAGAELEMAGPDGPRCVPMNEFYTGYKQLDKRRSELLVRVRVPLPRPHQTVRLYRVARRRDLDFATFTAGILMERDNAVIRHTRIALGAVGPTVLRARQTESYLTGKRFQEETMRAAGEIAVSEISPISDVRGSAEYRYQLTKNTFLKFYHEQASLPTRVSDKTNYNRR